MEELTRLQAADEVPMDRLWQQLCLLAELLGVVLAKMQLAGGSFVQSQDVIRWLQLRDGDQSNLAVDQPTVDSVSFLPLSLLSPSWDLMGPPWKYAYRPPLRHGRNALADGLQLRNESACSCRVNLHFWYAHSGEEQVRMHDKMLLLLLLHLGDRSDDIWSH